jgi:hypothetical protein
MNPEEILAASAESYVGSLFSHPVFKLDKAEPAAGSMQ